MCWQILSEALLLSLVGGVMGIAGGIGGAFIFGRTGGMSTMVVPSSTVLGFGLAKGDGRVLRLLPRQLGRRPRLDRRLALRVNEAG